MRYSLVKVSVAVVSSNVSPPVASLRGLRAMADPHPPEMSVPNGLAHVKPGLPPRTPYITPFVGRTQELVDIQSRLSDPACRLLTLVGPGGMGKTRLAQEVMPLIGHDFAHGVYFVHLQSVIS